MSVINNFLNDKQFWLAHMANLIADEKSRIVSNKLAEQQDVDKFVSSSINYMNKNSAEFGTDHVNFLHAQLQSIKLPGDFSKAASDFYKALDIPYEGEDFYDLSSLKRLKKEDLEEPEESDEEELEEALEGFEEESDEDHADDCDCSMCGDQMNPQEILAEQINAHLKKIAHSLGASGDHETAYKIEQTMRSIKVFALDKKLF